MIYRLVALNTKRESYKDKDLELTIISEKRFKVKRERDQTQNYTNKTNYNMYFYNKKS